MHTPELQANNDDGRFLLDRSQRSPLWRQIALTLEQEIHRGRYEPGDKLPTEGELSLWFGVNRHTVRRALFELRKRQLVKVEIGRAHV